MISTILLLDVHNEKVFRPAESEANVYLKQDFHRCSFDFPSHETNEAQYSFV